MSIIWSNPVNRSHPLNRGLVSWWLVTPNARGGLTFRDLAGHNNGTLTNMDPATDWKVGGHPGGFGYLDFDGSNDRVLASDSSLPSGNSPRTISMWAKTNSLPANGDFQMFCTYGTATSSDQIFFSLLQEGGIHKLDLDGYGDAVKVSYTAPIDQWFHIIALSTGAVTRFFVDGVQIGSDVSRSTLTTILAGTIYIGSWHTGGFPWDGQLDDIRIYNRTLNATEVRQLYNMSRTGYGDLLNRRRRVFKVPAAAGGGNAMPMAMHHYRQRRVG